MSNYTESLEKVKSWLSFNNIEPTDSNHFYLQGDSLDNFSKYLISNAHSSITVSNPYVDKCALSDSLMDSVKQGKSVLLITRPIQSNDRYYDSKRNYHESLKSSNVILAYNENVHAKILLVDECVAVVSSLNFTSTSSSGKSWEAGIVSMEPNVVEKVHESLDSVSENRDTLFQNPAIMIKLEKKINASPEKIFSYLTEPSRIPVWNSLVERVERDTNLPIKVGTVQTLYLKNTKIVKEVYLQFSENKMFTVTSNHEGLTGFGKWELVPVESSTLIRTIQGTRINKIMNGLEFRVMEKIIEKYVDTIFHQLVEML